MVDNHRYCGKYVKICTVLFSIRTDFVHPDEILHTNVGLQHRFTLLIWWLSFTLAL